MQFSCTSRRKIEIAKKYIYKYIYIFLLNPQHAPLHKISNTTCYSGRTFLLLVSFASIRYTGLSLQGPLSLYI